MLVSCGHFGVWPWTPRATVVEKAPKVVQNHRIGEPGGEYFDDILSFCRKWQTAFGLRLRGRISVGAPCFDTLGLHVCKHEK